MIMFPLIKSRRHGDSGSCSYDTRLFEDTVSVGKGAIN